MTTGPFGGRSDPVTGQAYRLQDGIPEATLTQCRHWVNFPQVRNLMRSLKNPIRFV